MSATAMDGAAGSGAGAGSACSFGLALAAGFFGANSVVSHGEAGAACGWRRTCSHSDDSFGGWICLTASCRARAPSAPCWT